MAEQSAIDVSSRRFMARGFVKGGKGGMKGSFVNTPAIIPKKGFKGGKK